MIFRSALRLADLEPGDGLGGGASDLGDGLAGAGDAEGAVGCFDGHGRSGVADADTDVLSGDGDLAAAADPPPRPWWWQSVGTSRADEPALSASGFGK